MSSSKKHQNKQQKQDKFIEEPIQTVDGQIRIKKYIIIQPVGSGSYSKCYLVKNTDSDSTYVAKVIPKRKLEILQKQKLIYQIKIHQSLSHQNVVHLDHWFEDQNNQYIFMQYCPNKNLENKLSQFNYNMTQKQIRRYGLQIVHAIAYIHSQNILHRDLKLCNFYLDQNNNVKLGDFGFACQLASDYDRKRQTCGTPNYIAPQAISGFGYSYSSDVWAIGVILFRLKYGVCPFEGQTVKKTLENVKLCNYKFPTKPKISSELRDLIEKIFQLNYDERLSTQQIMDHKFFQDDQVNGLQSNPSKQLKQQKRGFSLSRLFSLDKSKNVGQKSKDMQSKGNRQGMMERQSRNQSNAKQKKQEPKRSNSCQTFKEIKQIFKNKSKQNLQTSTNSNCNSNQGKKEAANSPYYTLNTFTINTNRQKDNQFNSKTNRASVSQYTYALGLNQTLQNSQNGNKKQQANRSNRLNQFIKSHVNSVTLKQQLKMNKMNSSKNSINSYTIVNTVNTEPVPKNKFQQTETNKEEGFNQLSNVLSTKSNVPTNPRSSNATNFINGNQKIVKISLAPHSQQLYNYSRKYYLPMQIQQEKDVTIIHYRPSVKQIIYSNVGYLMHRSVNNLYRMNGQLVTNSQLPKVLKYIIENRVQIKQYENNNQQYQYGQNNTTKILQLIPHSWVQLKEGILLKYNGHTNFVIARLFAQDGFYVCQDNSPSLMYVFGPDNIPKLLEGIVVMRIYGGWVKNLLKK